MWVIKCRKVLWLFGVQQSNSKLVSYNSFSLHWIFHWGHRIQYHLLIMMLRGFFRKDAFTVYWKNVESLLIVLFALLLVFFHSTFHVCCRKWCIIYLNELLAHRSCGRIHRLFRGKLSIPFKCLIYSSLTTCFSSTKLSIELLKIQHLVPFLPLTLLVEMSTYCGSCVIL